MCATEGASQMNTGMVNIAVKIEKKIEQLITQQRFLDYIRNKQKTRKIEQKTLREEFIRESGAALADVLIPLITI